MWFKWTFPRLRIDQLLTLEWKYLLPLNLLNLLADGDYRCVRIAFLTAEPAYKQTEYECF